MAYEKPTIEEFKTRFPEFAETKETLLNMLLKEAEGAADQSWVEKDYKSAIMYYAAHLGSIATRAVSLGDVAQFGAAIRSISFRDKMVGYHRPAAATAAASTKGPYSTPYGELYYDLLLKNRATFLIV